MNGHASLRTSVIITMFVAFAIVGAASVEIRQALDLDTAYVWAPRLLIALVGAFVIVCAPRSHPHATFGAANVVTAVRMAGVALVAGFVGQPASDRAAVIAIAIATGVTVCDGLDGWLARRNGTASAFGARFDMETDALLIMALSALTWEYGKAGVWILLSGLLRYLFVAAGWTWAWMQRPLPPRLRRKTVCVVQIVALLVALLPAAVPSVSTTIAAVSLAVLAWSFAVDTTWLWARRTTAGVPAFPSSSRDTGA